MRPWVLRDGVPLLRRVCVKFGSSSLVMGRMVSGLSGTVCLKLSSDGVAPPSRSSSTWSRTCPCRFLLGLDTFLASRAAGLCPPCPLSHPSSPPCSPHSGVSWQRMGRDGGQQALPEGLAGHPSHSLCSVRLTGCSALCPRRPQSFGYFLCARWSPDALDVTARAERGGQGGQGSVCECW